MGAIEIKQIVEGTRWSDFENVSKAQTSRGRGPVNIAIFALHQQAGIDSAAAVGIVEIVHVGIGLGLGERRECNERNDAEIWKQFEAFHGFFSSNLESSSTAPSSDRIRDASGARMRVTLPPESPSPV
jgi:hypothetical protein